MNAAAEQSLIYKSRVLSPPRVAKVEDLVKFLAARSNRRAIMDRLMGIVPALEAAGATSMGEDEIEPEVKAARAVDQAKGSDADRS